MSAQDDLEQLCERIAHRYYAPGLEHQDLAQAARIAVWRAQQTFDPSRGEWEAFARLAAERAIVSAVRAATRSKQAVLSHAVSYDEPLSDNGDTLADHLPACTDISAEYEARERVRGLFSGLSSLEAEVVCRRIGGDDYGSISADMDVSDKAIDNALTRVRRKAQTVLDTYDLAA